MIELYKLPHGHYDAGETRNFLDFRPSLYRDRNLRGIRLTYTRKVVKKTPYNSRLSVASRANGKPFGCQRRSTV